MTRTVRSILSAIVVVAGEIVGEVGSLHAELRALGRPEIGHADLAQAARRAWPDLDMRSALLRLPEALSCLKSEGAVRYPEARSSWHQGGIVALPLAVKLAKPRKQVASAAAPFAWHPDVAAASGLPETRKKEVLRRLSAWLSANGVPSEDLVPYRTRSAQIAGDEKAFDACGLIDGDLIFGVPLSRIGAFNPVDVLKVERLDGAPASILVVENLHSFHAIARVNGSARAYGAVVSGGGNAASSPSFAKALGQLADGMAARVDYFGDLDAPGVAIAARLDANLTATCALRCRPAMPLYEALRRLPPRHDARRSSVTEGWLGESLEQDVLEAFGQGMWWPQELCDSADLEAALRVVRSQR